MIVRRHVPSRLRRRADRCGAPRRGDGVRVLRGGAVNISPWQGCNELLAMLSAARGPHDMFTAVRPVLDLPTMAAAE
jgi:hypothetical protein